MADILQEIMNGVAAEFSDMPGAEQATRTILRLLLAAAIGGLLGYEREHRGKEAGLRTHMLVAMGTALFVMVPQLAGYSQESLARIIQGIAAGIGFLGAGTIIKQRESLIIHGLTTAASIWLTAALGVTVGLGREATALMSGGLAFIILRFLPHPPNPATQD